MEIKDYSTRRGVLVPMLAKIHALLKENAERDKLSGIEPPEHIITWQQKVKKELMDIDRRFLLAMDGGVVAGFFFYRYRGTDIFIENVQTAWAYRNNPHIIDGFLKKLEFDSGTKDAVFYASGLVKIDADKEKLAAKGFKDSFEGGWEELGPFKEMSGALKQRYIRSV